MSRISKSISCLFTMTLLLSALCLPSFGADANVRKSVTTLENGEFLIKLSVTATGSSIYALTLIDPGAGIIDIYAPRGWCMATDGEDLLARTEETPIKPGQSLEFIIHASTDQVNYTFTVWNKMKQLGGPGVVK